MTTIMIKNHNNTDTLIHNESALTQRQALAYGLPLLSLSFLFGPINILQGMYAKHFGLTLTSIATVLLIARLFDAVSDPVIGYCSDRYYARQGHRKPFIVTGGLLFVVASWFLYVPPVDVSAGYFLGWFLAFYLAYTLFEIPHLAWGSELANDSQEKNRVFGLRSLFVFMGILLFYIMPLLPLFETNEFTPETLKWSVIVAGSFMLPLLYFSIKTVPDAQKLPSLKTQKDSLRVVLQSIFTNKPLLTLTAAHICTGFGSGMWFTLLFIVVDTYLGLGAQFAMVFAISFAISILSLRLWYLLSNHWSKQTTWIIAMVLVMLGSIGCGFLSPENTGWLALMFCMTLIISGFACFSIMVPSLLSDIVDYGTWKFGTDRAATYFSLYTFINKSVGALGGALGLAIAGWVGFDPTASTHNDMAIFGVRFTIAWIPALFILLSIVFIARIPITAHRHAVIRRRLDSRFARAAKAMKSSSYSADETTIEGDLAQSKSPQAFTLLKE